MVDGVQRILTGVGERVQFGINQRLGFLEGNLFFQPEGGPVQEVPIFRFEHRYGFRNPIDLLKTWEWPTYICRVSRIFWDSNASVPGQYFVRPGIVDPLERIPVVILKQRSPDQEIFAIVTFAATEDYAFGLLAQYNLNIWEMQVGESTAAIVQPNPMIFDATEKAYKALGFNKLGENSLPAEAKIAVVAVTEFQAAIASGLAERLENGDPSRVPAYIEFYRFSRQAGATLSQRNGTAQGNQHNGARYLLTNTATNDIEEYFLHEPQFDENATHLKLMLLRCDSKTPAVFLTAQTPQSNIDILVTIPEGDFPIAVRFENRSTEVQSVVLDTGILGNPAVDLIANPDYIQIYFASATATVYAINRAGQVESRTFVIEPQTAVVIYEGDSRQPADRSDGVAIFTLGFVGSSRQPSDRSDGIYSPILGFNGTSRQPADRSDGTYAPTIVFNGASRQPSDRSNGIYVAAQLVFNGSSRQPADRSDGIYAPAIVFNGNSRQPSDRSNGTYTIIPVFNGSSRQPADRSNGTYAPAIVFSGSSRQPSDRSNGTYAIATVFNGSSRQPADRSDGLYAPAVVFVGSSRQPSDRSNGLYVPVLVFNGDSRQPADRSNGAYVPTLVFNGSSRQPSDRSDGALVITQQPLFLFFF